MTTKIETAMVLAAGLGSRMRPLTSDKPKPLVEVGGYPLIEHVLSRLVTAGVTRAVVNVHYLADQLIAALQTRDEPEILISEERDTLLDTGGGVLNALDLIGPNPFFVHNSDSIWVEGVQSNLDRMCRYWDPERMDSLLLLALSGDSLGYTGRGDFVMEAGGQLTRRREREVSPFVFAGVSIAHPRLFDDAPTGAFSLNLLWDKAIENQRLYGLRLEGKWMHVGTPSGLAQAEAALLEHDG